MQYSIFENIEHHKDYPDKIFVLSIDHSDLHWHYDYELVVVLKGSLTLNYGLQRYVIREGDIVLVNSKIIHGYRNIIDNLCLFVQFPPQLLEQVLNKNQVYYFYLNSASKTMRPKTQFSVFVHTAVELGMRRNPRNPADILRINSLLYMLLADLVEYSHYDIYQYPDRAAFENDSEMFLRAIQFVEQNLKNENIKQELCRYVGMSEKPCIVSQIHHRIYNIRSDQFNTHTKSKNHVKAVRQISFVHLPGMRIQLRSYILPDV